MKIAITGTHFTPAQAVIEELMKYSNMEIFYLGRNTTREGDKSASVESNVLPKLGVKFFPIISGRLQKVLTPYTIPSLLKIPVGFIQSFFILLIYKPNVVLSFGGYVSVPVVISAWLLSIPIITHEQTIVRGLSYKITSLFANKMAVSFKTGLVGERTIVTGNPMRAGILKSTLPSYKIKRLFQKARQQKKPVIFITGGNQGSHIINQTVLEALPALTLKAVIVLQTGDSKFHDFEDAKSKQCEELLTEKWIETQDFGYILKHAHLVVGRSGINTLLECAMFGTPALLIPYPYLQGDEQMVNARFFESLGLAKILPQKDLNSETLISSISSMLENIEKLKKQAVAAKSIVTPDAAKRLAQETLLLATKADE